jgi:hypothetical protein
MLSENPNILNARERKEECDEEVKGESTKARLLL